jgi:hypothetical protein
MEHIEKAEAHPWAEDSQGSRGSGNAGGLLPDHRQTSLR